MRKRRPSTPVVDGTGDAPGLNPGEGGCGGQGEGDESREAALSASKAGLDRSLNRKLAGGIASHGWSRCEAAVVQEKKTRTAVCLNILFTAT